MVPQEPQRQKAKADQDAEQVYTLSFPALQRQPSERRTGCLILARDTGQGALPGGILFPWRDFHRGEAHNNAELTSEDLRVAKRIFSYK